MLLSLIAAILLGPQAPDTLSAASVTGRLQLSPPTDAVHGEKLQQATSLADAVREFSGLQLRDYGGVGGLKTINVRSLGSAHTAIFLDGIPIDNAQNMQVDLGRIATSSLESAELYQGQRSRLLQSAREYGSASSLHLSSAIPAQRQRIRLHVHGGAFGTVAPEAAWERGLGPALRARLQVAGSKAHGRYPFHLTKYRNTPEGVRGYDTLMTRENGDIMAFRALGQLYYLRDDGQYQLSVSGYDCSRGIPGPVYKQSSLYQLSQDRQQDQSLSVQLGGEQVLSQRLQLLVRAKYALDRLSYLDVSEQDPSISAQWDYLQQSVYVSGALDWAVWDCFHLGAAADGQWEALQAREVSPQRKTLFTALSGTFLKDPWRAGLSVQYQLSDGAGRYSFLSPAFLLDWHPVSEWEFGGLVKRSCRLPTFNDLYYTNVTSRSLLPESVWQTAARWRWRKSYGRWWFQAQEELYYNWVQNKLVAVPNGSLFRWSMYNIGGVRIFGDEIAVSATYTAPAWSAGGTARYTFQWARDTQTGGQIPYIPLHSASWDLFASWQGVRLQIQGYLNSERFSSSTNRAEFRLAPWTTWDASLSWQWQSLRLGLQLKNLLNQQYELVQQYPMPGFHVLASIDYSF